MDSRNYPEGKTPFYSKYVNGILKFYRRSDKALFMSIDGANKVLKLEAVGQLKIGADSVGVSTIADVTATATEINYIDGTVLGTVVASKAVAVDANKDVASFRDVTVRHLTHTNLVGSGNVTLSGSNVVKLNLPTSDPAVAGQLWADTGTVKVSAG